ncbi:TIGR01244 family sulfur transferase [Phenylobacterium sp.]|uniref:TIGR01244 family sulfur transferase n=1 Tax=Phenylobacterium sp. TaxID=1871053 RepID=UPI003BAC1A81
MTEFRRVTDQLSVSPQISLEDLPRAAAMGFKLVINNRPDGEDPAQPPSAVVEAAAKAAGLAYAYIPVRGGPTQEQVAEERSILENSEGPVLAFCRSGTRSIITWSLGEALDGARSRDELVKLGEQAGYDLNGVLPTS